MAIDCLGGVFSILSLIFKQQVDVLAAVAYALVVVRPPTARISIVFVLAMILNPRAKRVAQRREQNSRDGVRDVALGGGTKMAAIPASGVQDHK